MFDWRVVYCDPTCRGDMNDEQRFFRSELGAQQQAEMHNRLYHDQDIACAKTRRSTDAEQPTRGEVA